MALQRRAEVTRLLLDARRGRSEALNELLPVVYDELHRLAHRQRGFGNPGMTINTTALVHEAYLKLINAESTPWQDRTHFFCVAARAMRQIITDYARRQQRLKRSGSRHKVSIESIPLFSEQRAEEVLALDEALSDLAAFDERQSEVVELRYFAGFTIPETADLLDISPATVKREWTAARAWLHREISREG